MSDDMVNLSVMQRFPPGNPSTLTSDQDYLHVGMEDKVLISDKDDDELRALRQAALASLKSHKPGRHRSVLPCKVEKSNNGLEIPQKADVDPGEINLEAQDVISTLSSHSVKSASHKTTAPSFPSDIHCKSARSPACVSTSTVPAGMHVQSSSHLGLISNLGQPADETISTVSEAVTGNGGQCLEHRSVHLSPQGKLEVHFTKSPLHLPTLATSKRPESLSIVKQSISHNAPTTSRQRCETVPLHLHNQSTNEIGPNNSLTQPNTAVATGHSVQIDPTFKLNPYKVAIGPDGSIVVVPKPADSHEFIPIAPSISQSYRVGYHNQFADEVYSVQDSSANSSCDTMHQNDPLNQTPLDQSSMETAHYDTTLSYLAKPEDMVTQSSVENTPFNNESCVFTKNMDQIVTVNLDRHAVLKPVAEMSTECNSVAGFTIGLPNTSKPQIEQEASLQVTKGATSKPYPSMPLVSPALKQSDHELSPQHQANVGNSKTEIPKPVECHGLLQTRKNFSVLIPVADSDCIIETNTPAAVGGNCENLLETSARGSKDYLLGFHGSVDKGVTSSGSTKQYNVPDNGAEEHNVSFPVSYDADTGTFPGIPEEVTAPYPTTSGGDASTLKASVNACPPTLSRSVGKNHIEPVSLHDDPIQPKVPVRSSTIETGTETAIECEEHTPTSDVTIGEQSIEIPATMKHKEVEAGIPGKHDKFLSETREKSLTMLPVMFDENSMNVPRNIDEQSTSIKEVNAKNVVPLTKLEEKHSIMAQRTATRDMWTSSRTNDLSITFRRLPKTQSNVLQVSPDEQLNAISETHEEEMAIEAVPTEHISEEKTMVIGSVTPTGKSECKAIPEAAGKEWVIPIENSAETNMNGLKTINKATLSDMELKAETELPLSEIALDVVDKSCSMPSTDSAHVYEGTGSVLCADPAEELFGHSSMFQESFAEVIIETTATSEQVISTEESGSSTCTSNTENIESCKENVPENTRASSVQCCTLSGTVVIQDVETTSPEQNSKWNSKNAGRSMVDIIDVVQENTLICDETNADKKICSDMALVNSPHHGEYIVSGSEVSSNMTKVPCEMADHMPKLPISQGRNDCPIRSDVSAWGNSTPKFAGPSIGKESVSYEKSHSENPSTSNECIVAKGLEEMDVQGEPAILQRKHAVSCSKCGRECLPIKIQQTRVNKTRYCGLSTLQLRKWLSSPRSDACRFFSASSDFYELCPRASMVTYTQQEYSPVRPFKTLSDRFQHIGEKRIIEGSHFEGTCASADEIAHLQNSLHQKGSQFDDLESLLPKNYTSLLQQHKEIYKGDESEFDLEFSMRSHGIDVDEVDGKELHDKTSHIAGKSDHDLSNNICGTSGVTSNSRLAETCVPREKVCKQRGREYRREGDEEYINTAGKNRSRRAEMASVIESVMECTREKPARTGNPKMFKIPKLKNSAQTNLVEGHEDKENSTVTKLASRKTIASMQRPVTACRESRSIMQVNGDPVQMSDSMTKPTSKSSRGVGELINARSEKKCPDEDFKNRKRPKNRKGESENLKRGRESESTVKAVTMHISSNASVSDQDKTRRQQSSMSTSVNQSNKRCRSQSGNKRPRSSSPKCMAKSSLHHKMKKATPASKPCSTFFEDYEETMKTARKFQESNIKNASSHGRKSTVSIGSSGTLLNGSEKNLETAKSMWKDGERGVYRPAYVRSGSNAYGLPTTNSLDVLPQTSHGSGNVADFSPEQESEDIGTPISDLVIGPDRLIGPDRKKEDSSLTSKVAQEAGNDQIMHTINGVPTSESVSFHIPTVCPRQRSDGLLLHDDVSVAGLFNGDNVHATLGVTQMESFQQYAPQESQSWSSFRSPDTGSSSSTYFTGISSYLSDGMASTVSQSSSSSDYAYHTDIASSPRPSLSIPHRSLDAFSTLVSDPTCNPDAKLQPNICGSMKEDLMKSELRKKQEYSRDGILMDTQPVTHHNTVMHCNKETPFWSLAPGTVHETLYRSNITSLEGNAHSEKVHMYPVLTTGNAIEPHIGSGKYANSSRGMDQQMHYSSHSARTIQSATETLSGDYFECGQDITKSWTSQPAHRYTGEKRQSVAQTQQFNLLPTPTAPTGKLDGSNIILNNHNKIELQAHLSCATEPAPLYPSSLPQSEFQSSQSDANDNDASSTCSDESGVNPCLTRSRLEDEWNQRTDLESMLEGMARSAVLRTGTAPLVRGEDKQTEQRSVVRVGGVKDSDVFLVPPPPPPPRTKVPCSAVPENTSQVQTKKRTITKEEYFRKKSLQRAKEMKEDPRGQVDVNKTGKVEQPTTVVVNVPIRRTRPETRGIFHGKTLLTGDGPNPRIIPWKTYPTHQKPEDPRLDSSLLPPTRISRTRTSVYDAMRKKEPPKDPRRK